MKIAILAVAIAALSVAPALAQKASQVAAPAGASGAMTMQSSPARGGRVRPGVPRVSGASQLATQQIKELEETIAKMQALLKAIKVKATASKNKTDLQNVELWELLVNHLDQTLAREKRVAAERAELMARRESLYRQSQMNAEAEAVRARAAATNTLPGANGTLITNTQTPTQQPATVHTEAPQQ